MCGGSRRRACAIAKSRFVPRCAVAWPRVLCRRPLVFWRCHPGPQVQHSPCRRSPASSPSSKSKTASIRLAPKITRTKKCDRPDQTTFACQQHVRTIILAIRQSGSRVLGSPQPGMSRQGLAPLGFIDTTPPHQFLASSTTTEESTTITGTSNRQAGAKMTFCVWQERQRKGSQKVWPTVSQIGKIMSMSLGHLQHSQYHGSLRQR